MFNRIILKISGEVLAGDYGDGVANGQFTNYNEETMLRIVRETINVLKTGCEVGLVVGGGNIWRGRSADDKMDRTRADQIGMLATVMNAIYLSELFKQEFGPVSVFTPVKVSTWTKVFDKEEVLASMKQNKLVIFAAGTGHPFFSTDTIAALRAAELDCEAVLFAKNIDGVYNKDPLKSSDAEKFNTISYDEVIARNLQVIDIPAISLLGSRGIESIVFDLRKDDSMAIASENGDSLYTIGTRITV